MNKIRLLVLSVGTRVGQNVLTVLAGRRHVLSLIATSSVANEPALFDYDAVHLVPATKAEPEAFERALLDIVARERIDLVIPCRDDDVVFLAGLRDRRPDLGRRFLCGSLEAARVIIDKWESALIATANGLPFVPSLVNGAPHERAAFSAEHGFPLIVKPRCGYASQEVYFISNETQLERALAPGDRIVQRFLGDERTISDYLAGLESRGIPLFHTFQGLKHSIQVLIAPDGAVEHVFCTTNASDRRRFKRVEPDLDPEATRIGQRCGEVFGSLGWRGPLNIQCLRSREGTLLIHEFNGRFTGATVERWLLGFDEVGTAIERFTGLRVENDRPRAAAALEAFESMVSRGADPRQVEALARDRVWRRAP